MIPVQSALKKFPAWFGWAAALVFVALLVIQIVFWCDRLQQNNGSGLTLDIATGEPGLYYLSSVELDRLGLQIRHPEAYTLTENGVPVGFLIEQTDMGFDLTFYATSAGSRNFAGNVYQLTDAGGNTPRIDPEIHLPGTKDPLSIVPYRIHLEQDNDYQPTNGLEDHWVWGTLTAPAQLSIPFEIQQPGDNAGRLTVHVWGVTQSSAGMDYCLSAQINGKTTSQQCWDGSGEKEVVFDLPAGSIQSGTNTIDLELEAQPGQVSRLLLESLDVDCFRTAALDFETIAWTGTDAPVTFSSRWGGIVVDISNPSQPVWAGKFQPGTTTFQGIPSHEYLISDGLEEPEHHLVTGQEDLRSVRFGDYLAIGPQALLEAAEPLFQLREQQGLKVVRIPIDWLADQFNGGRVEAQAITKYLRWMKAVWPVPARYVLLLGDASTNTRNRSGLTVDGVPTAFVDTILGGESPSDVALADLNGDARMEIAIGRLPFQTTEEVQQYIDKVKAYEAAGSTNTFAVVYDPSDAQFAEDAEAIAASASGLVRIPVCEGENAGADCRSVAQLFGDDVDLVIYTGHGSLGLWSREGLLKSEQIGDLSCGAFCPVVMNFSCLTGYFVHPSTESIGELLLQQPDGGAVGAILPTGLTLPDDQLGFADELVSEFAEASGSRLGDLLYQYEWERSTGTAQGLLDVRRTYLLLGDPALILH